jgi:hypothetical protein
MRSLARAIVVVGSLALAASAVAAPAAWRVVTSRSASGDFAIVLADATIRKPRVVAVRVLARPKQRVSAGWTVLCSKGPGAGSRNDQASGRAPLTSVVRLPVNGADDCTIAATGQLMGGGGRVTVQILRG